MAETIDSLLISLGMDADKKSFDEANNMIKEVKNSALQFAALAGSGAGLVALANNTAKNIVSLSEMSKLLGVNVNEILRLEHAFGRLGLSASNAFSLLQKARNWSFQARFGELPDEMVRALGSVNVSPVQLQNAAPVKAVDIVATAYGRMNRDNQMLFARGAGVSQDEIAYLSRDRKWRSESRKQFDQRNPGVSQSDIQASENLVGAVNNVMTTTGGMWDEAMIALMPKLTDAVEGLDKFLNANRGEILDFFRKSLPFLEATAIGIAALVASRGLGKAGGVIMGMMRSNPILSAGLATMLLSGDSATMTPEEIKKSQEFYANLGFVNDSNISKNSTPGDMSTPEARRSSMINEMRDPNVRAFLKAIRDHESGDSYNTLYGGGKFTDMSRHPGYQLDKKITVPGRAPFHPSASGAYQIIKKTYDDYADLYGVKGFFREDQDVLAMALLYGNGYLQKIKDGKFDEVLNDPKFGKLWASAPGSKEGQNPKSLNSWMRSINNARMPNNFNLSGYAPQSRNSSSSVTNNAPSITNLVTINTASDKVEDTARVVRQVLSDLQNEAKVAQGRKWQ